MSIWCTNTGELAGRSWRSTERFTHLCQRLVQVNVQLEDTKVGTINKSGVIVKSPGNIRTWFCYYWYLAQAQWFVITHHVLVGFPRVRNEELDLCLCSPLWITRLGCGNDYTCFFIGKIPQQHQWPQWGSIQNSTPQLPSGSLDTPDFFKSACPNLYVCYQIFSTHGILSESRKSKATSIFKDVKRWGKKPSNSLFYCTKSTGKETGGFMFSKIFKYTCVPLRWDNACGSKQGNLLIRSSKKHGNTFQQCLCRDRAFDRLLQLTNRSCMNKNFPQFSYCIILQWKI